MWNLAAAYKRWRHSKGYGVHSPLAYRLVKEVVRPEKGYYYYGYDDIEESLVEHGLRHSRRHARMLLRLAAFLDVRSAYMPVDDRTSPFLAALLAVRSDMHITAALSEAQQCDLVASTGDFAGIDTLCHQIARPGCIVALRDAPAGWSDRIFEALPEGVMLYSKDALIALHRPGVNKVKYSIKL